MRATKLQKFWQSTEAAATFSVRLHAENSFIWENHRYTFSFTSFPSSFIHLIKSKERRDTEISKVPRATLIRVLKSGLLHVQALKSTAACGVDVSRLTIRSV